VVNHGELDRLENGFVQCGNALYEEYVFSDGFGLRADLVEHVLVGRLCQCGSGELAGACNVSPFFCEPEVRWGNTPADDTNGPW
jgi:hypothetical protein